MPHASVDTYARFLAFRCHPGSAVAGSIGLVSKRAENLCEIVARNLSRNFVPVRHTLAIGKCPARLAWRRPWKS